MDLRIQRTRKSIINAFIELRAAKPLEKITVKELSDLAFINKATFYTHYKDIYDLAEQLENEAVTSILNDIPHPEYLVTHPKQGIMELTSAFLRQGNLFHILFSGTRQGILIERLENNLKEKIYSIYPEYKTNLEKELLLSVLIHGNFRAFVNHSNENFDKVIEILGNISECLMQNYECPALKS